MEAKLSSDGVGSCSSGEFHEHGDWRKMVESQEKVFKLIVEVNK
jgi:hypothetical protein